MHATTNMHILQSGKTGSGWKYNTTQKLPRNQQTSVASSTYVAKKTRQKGEVLVSGVMCSEVHHLHRCFYIHRALQVLFLQT